MTETLDDHNLIELHDALHELESNRCGQSQAGGTEILWRLSMEQLCEALQISRATAHRHWNKRGLAIPAHLGPK